MFTAWWWCAALVAASAATPVSQHLTKPPGELSAALPDARITHDFVFSVVDTDQPVLQQFLQYPKRLDYYREHATRIDLAMFAPIDPDLATGANAASPMQVKDVLLHLPDTLSKNNDLRGKRDLEHLNLRPALAVFMAHKGLAVEEFVDMVTPLPPPTDGAARPVCPPLNLQNTSLGATLRSLADLAHVWADAPLDPTPTLERLAWPAVGAGVLVGSTTLRVSNAEMGARLARAMRDPASTVPPWVLHALAGLYFRFDGQAADALTCFLNAAATAPRGYLDLPLANIGTMLYSANVSSAARHLLLVTLSAYEPLFVTNMIQGLILVNEGMLNAAVRTFTRALQLKPTFAVAATLLEAVSTTIKQKAIARRRDHEINTRKLTMVLPAALLWDDFDYEASDDLCSNTHCPAHSACSPVDGNCHCNSGYMQVGQECAADPACAGVACERGAACAGGVCVCKLGYSPDKAKGAVPGTCRMDKCALVNCVAFAQCDAQTGMCQCEGDTVPWEGHCVSPDCQQLNCGEHEFCSSGQCYCLMGYVRIAPGKACVPDTPCAKASCPVNAQCDPKDGHCRCLPGYAADYTVNECTPVARSFSSPAESCKALLDDLHELQNQKDDGSTADHFRHPHCTAENVESPTFENMPSIAPLLDMGPVTVLADTPEAPYCSGTFFSANTMAHVPGLQRPPAAALAPERKLSDSLRRHLLSGNDIKGRPLAAVGRQLAAGLLQAGTPIRAAALQNSIAYWRARGNTSEAFKCMRDALFESNYAQKGPILIHVANILLRTGDITGAVSLTKLALTFADMALGYATLCYAFTLMGQLAKAVGMCERALDMGCVDSRSVMGVYFNTACMHLGDLGKEAKKQTDKEERVKLQDQAVLVKHRITDLAGRLFPASTRPEIAAAPSSPPGMSTEASTAAAAPAASKNAEQLADEGIVAVEYPTKPAIPALIAAVESLLDERAGKNAVFQPFDDPAWPGPHDCAESAVPQLVCASDAAPLHADAWRTTPWTADSLTGADAELVEKRADSGDVVPECTGPLPLSPLDALAHLKSVSAAVEYSVTPEHSLSQVLGGAVHAESVTAISVAELGARLTVALGYNKTDWTLLTLAGFWWSMEGHYQQGVECFRRGFANAPRELKDLPLLGLGHLVWRAGLVVEASILLQMAIQVAPETAANHLLMGNILCSVGKRGFEEAAFFFEAALRLHPGLPDAVIRARSVRCAQRGLFPSYATST